MIADRIYHYTNLKDAESIVRNHELWLTHYRDVDDQNEFTLGLDKVYEIMHNRLQNFIFDEFYTSLTGTPQKWLEEDPLYIACLCNRNDNQYLWDNYTGENGVCIEIDTQNLGDKLIRNKNNRICQMTNVHYNLGAFLQSAETQISSAEYPDQLSKNKFLKSYAKQYPFNREQMAMFLNSHIPYVEFRNRISDIVVKAILQKDPKYQEEEEVRIINGRAMGTTLLQEFPAYGKRRVKIPLSVSNQSFILSVRNRAGELISF